MTMMMMVMVMDRTFGGVALLLHAPDRLSSLNHTFWREKL
jgi:hypothetical protein